MLYLGQKVLSHSSLVASKMEQNIGLLKVGHLQDANAMMFKLQKIRPRIVYRFPEDIGEVIISTISN